MQHIIQIVSAFYLAAAGAKVVLVGTFGRKTVNALDILWGTNREHDWGSAEISVLDVCDSVVERINETH